MHMHMQRSDRLHTENDGVDCDDEAGCREIGGYIDEACMDLLGAKHLTQRYNHQLNWKQIARLVDDTIRYIIQHIPVASTVIKVKQVKVRFTYIAPQLHICLQRSCSHRQGRRSVQAAAGQAALTDFDHSSRT